MKKLPHLIGAALLVFMPLLVAQNNTLPVESMTKDQIDQGSKILGDMMVSQALDNQLKRMVSITMEEQLVFLEKPETMERMAKILKKYHEELKEVGFSDDQAFEIISKTSLLTSLMK